MPKIHAERMAAAQEKSTRLDGKRFEDLQQTPTRSNSLGTEQQIEAALRPKLLTEMQNPPDEPFHEMTKEARVWKTSLDVLLIFAALFSAISTSFIINSLGDLKPDSTESSAQTLHVISQTLAAMANNQPVLLAAGGSSSAAASSPSSTAVLVNILWLLSLSLSVVVSLIAMLAKDWCYKFMSRRYGQIYDQARLRQQKWDGMERWKMQEILMYLPGMMHLAVLLFAVGLSIYLWGISASVAAPVTVVTTLGLFVYASTTVLPVLDHFCPYGTPITIPVIFTLTKLGKASSKMLEKFCSLARLTLDRIFGPSRPHPRWLEIAIQHIMQWLILTDTDDDSEGKTGDDNFANMDAVTSRMLAWMLKYCEDSRSVDIALQAIAGARPELPHYHILQHGGLDLVHERLKACVRLNQSRGRYQLRDANLLPTALKYSRAYSVLMSEGLYLIPEISWKMPYLDGSLSSIAAGHEMNLDAQHIHKDLLIHATQAQVDSSVFAAAEMAPMLFYERDLMTPRESKLLPPATEPKHLVSSLHQHVLGQDTPLSTPTLLALIEYSVYYLISGWSTDKKRRRCPLPAILIHIFLASHDVAPDVGRTVAVTLAATAFAVDPHHGGEGPSEEAEDRQKRAMQMVQHYRAHNPDEGTVNRLFVFGFVGLLPHIDLRLQDTQSTTLPGQFAGVVAWAPVNGFEYRVYGLPDMWSCYSHCNFSVRRCLLRVAYHSEEESAITLLMSTILRAGFAAHWDKSRLYLPALITLRHAQSSELQDICLDILESPNLSFAIQSALDLMEKDTMLRVLTESPHDVAASVAPAFLFYFRRLVAGIMLSPFKPLDERRAPLRRLLNRPAFVSIVPAPTDQAPPDEERILGHAAEDTDDMSQLEGILSTMQLVAKFCYADGHPEYRDSQPQTWHNETFVQANWIDQLLGIKREFRPEHAKHEGDQSDIIEESKSPMPESGSNNEKYADGDD